VTESSIRPKTQNRVKLQELPDPTRPELLTRWPVTQKSPGSNSAALYWSPNYTVGINGIQTAVKCTDFSMIFHTFVGVGLLPRIPQLTLPRPRKVGSKWLPSHRATPGNPNFTSVVAPLSSPTSVHRTWASNTNFSFSVNNDSERFKMEYQLNTQGDLRQLFFRHDVGQALRNVCYCDITFLVRQRQIRTFS